VTAVIVRVGAAEPSPERRARATAADLGEGGGDLVGGVGGHAAILHVA
jgi:hypothetical protein